MTNATNDKQRKTYRKIANLEDDIDFWERKIELDYLKAKYLNAKIREASDQIDSLYATLNA